MKHEDLIQKLENLETPEIELLGHKQALKMALLSSGRFKERTIMDWAKILAPVTAAVLLIAVVGFFNVIQPRLQMAQAKELAMNDPQVQELMGEYGLEITEVKLQNGEAFVLLTPEQSRPDEDILTAPGEGSFSTCNITVSGYILKVNLAEEKVTEFGKVDEITGLRDINLDDIDFAKLEPLEGEEPEEDLD
ncbi:MAG: hypothetical protein KAS83_00075 [Dehalococcoidia bacterium]|nr:hypothetical protein [Dehalococcoidia bacterium]